MKEGLYLNRLNFHILAKGHDIPAVFWGNPADAMIIAVHGMMSNKTDAVIADLADVVVCKGYCVLSFDLPEHGERMGTDFALTPDHAVGDLQSVYDYAKTCTRSIVLFGCSLGAYLSLIAYPEGHPQQVLFLSPLVDMQSFIQGVMTINNIDDEQLKREQTIAIPNGPPLSWAYLQQAIARPVSPTWDCPIDILYGANDTVVPKSQIDNFAQRYRAQVQILAGGDHFFHTKDQMTTFRSWIDRSLV